MKQVCSLANPVSTESRLNIQEEGTAQFGTWLRGETRPSVR